MRYRRIIGGLLLGVGLALTLLIGLSVRSEKALADTLCVTPGGSGGCYASVQVAIEGAGDGDTIRVAAGTYHEAVVLSKSVTLEGGWAADFTARDWDLYVTTIDAQRAGPVIWVNAAVSPTIEGFTLTGGDDTAHLGWGGGIKIYRSGGIDVEGLTTIRHNVITDNVACHASSCQGHGGGIHVYRSSALIEHNTIISNAARTGGDGGGQGGGVRVWTANATLIDNTIVGNTAVYSTTGLWTGEGGGVGAEYAQSAVLEGNEIRGNVAAVRGDGYGGGIWANARLYGNRILSNTASVYDDGYGGGVYAYYVSAFNGNLVQGNVASENGDGTGGGIYAVYLKSAQHNAIEGNVAARGGGIYMKTYSGNEGLYYNRIAHNQATGLAVYDGGGGIASAADWVEIVGNEFYENRATGGLQATGGGLLVTQGSRFVVRENRFEANDGVFGGGIAVYTATGTIADNQVVYNEAYYGGGMFLWGRASPELDRNVVMSNTAYGLFNPAGGGGLLIDVDDGTTITVTNHIIAQNAAGPAGHGGGVECWRGNCVLINNTIVDNDRGVNQEGVIIGSSYGGAHVMRNNIIVGHSIGISRTAGTLTLDYNDYYDNATDVSGVAWGPHHRNDAPQFDDRVGGDYHLTLTSLLIDQGDGGVDVPFDFEGDSRPRGGGIDIGADEAYRAESYVSELTGSDLTGDGSPGSPFATVTRGLTETRSGGTVYVGRGNYTERVTITHSVALLGGYYEGDWSRDIAAHVTTLNAEGTGTVVTIYGDGVNATVEGFTITGGEASLYGSGGGILVYDDAAATIRRNTIAGNHAQNGGGGLALWGSEFVESVVDSNRIYGNTADGVFVFPDAGDSLSPQQGPEPGGGLLLGSGSARVVNNWIYDNVAAAGGDGMALSGWDEPVQAHHNTVVDNGDSAGIGIEIIGPVSQVALYNNLIVGHGTAITATPGAVASWDYNGFYDNAADYAPGLSGGPHDTYGNPHFASRPADDYHIWTCSPVAGAGADVGIGVDIDGDPRPLPIGTQPDLGADEIEQHCLYMHLPLVLRDS
jgi:hypothetical protein